MLQNVLTLQEAELNGREGSTPCHTTPLHGKAPAGPMALPSLLCFLIISVISTSIISFHRTLKFLLNFWSIDRFSMEVQWVYRCLLINLLGF